MEESILKIIESHYPEDIDVVAKEITSHVMEFIEWLGEHYNYGRKSWMVRYADQRIRYNWKTTEEVYQYWLKNIYK
jgi:uncharacterized protein YbbC (DUF1343 family)